MIRRSFAGAILGLSLLAASFAWSGLLAQRTVFDPNRSRQIAEELLDNEEVRAQLIDNLSDAITAAIPSEVPVSDQLVESVAAQVLNDPAVEAVILDAFTDTHAAFLGDGDAPTEIDLTAVADATRAALVQAAPQLDSVLPTTSTLVVPLPTEHVPDASPVRSFVRRAVPVLALLAIGGAIVALVATTDRPSILRRAGIWAITTTAVYLAIGLGVPELLRQFAPDGAEVVAALLSALLRATLAPSIVLGLLGIALIVVSGMWPSGFGRGRAASPVGPREVIPQIPVGAAVGTAQTAQRAQPAATPPSLEPMYKPPPQRLTRPDQARPVAPYPDAAPARLPYPDAPRAPSPQHNVPITPAPSAAPMAAPQPSVTQPSVPQPSAPQASTPRHGVPEAPAPQHGAPQSPTSSASAPAATPPAQVAFAPSWVEGHGWVLHPDDPRPLPASARWVDGIGHVVPGPPPAS